MLLLPSLEGNITAPEGHNTAMVLLPSSFPCPCASACSCVSTWVFRWRKCRDKPILLVCRFLL